MRQILHEEQSQVIPILISRSLRTFRTNLFLGIESCSKSIVKQQERPEKMHNKSIEEVLKQHTDSWMAIDGVEGTAIGLFEDKLCIKIFSSIPTVQLREKIPSTVEDYLVIIKETGTFRALHEQ